MILKKDKRETIHNLQGDWEGILDWYGVRDQEMRREIIKMAAYEVDCFRKQPFYKKVLNQMPEWNPFK